jgi:hypothetical protein
VPDSSVELAATATVRENSPYGRGSSQSVLSENVHELTVCFQIDLLHSKMH